MSVSGAPSTRVGSEKRDGVVGAGTVAYVAPVRFVACPSHVSPSTGECRDRGEGPAGGTRPGRDSENTRN